MNKRVRLALICAAPFALAWGWSGAASAIYLHGKGFSDAFEAPWLQWWIALQYAIQDGFPKTLGGWNEWIWLTFGGGVPSLVVVGLVRLWWAHRSTVKPIYGKTEFAGRKEMQANKIASTRRPV
jgi:hypothetical protein